MWTAVVEMRISIEAGRAVGSSAGRADAKFQSSSMVEAAPLLAFGDTVVEGWGCDGVGFAKSKSELEGVWGWE